MLIFFRWTEQTGMLGWQGYSCNTYLRRNY